MNLRSALVSVLAALSACLAGAAPGWPADPAGEAAPPFIPSFWDPHAPAEKPDLSALKTIRFVTGADYPPFNFTLTDGTLAGFNVDLARALCAELQLTCTIQARSWSALPVAVATGKADAAIASMSIDDRMPDLTFTAAYYKTPARFVVRLPTTLSAALPEALDGKRVGVQAGTAHEAYLKGFFPKLTIKTYPTVEAARTALKAGEVDAVFGDAIAAAAWLGGSEAGTCCGFVGGPYTESRYFGPGAGIAVRKGDILLRQALDYALARVAAKGIYGDLYLRYFPTGFY